MTHATNAGLHTQYIAIAQQHTESHHFYFNTVEEFKVKARFDVRYRLMQPIGTTDEEQLNSELFGILDIDSSTLELWFDTVINLPLEEKVKLAYLFGFHSLTSLDKALTKLDAVIIFNGTASEAVGEMVDESFNCLEIPQWVRSYFDYQFYEADLHLEGSIKEFDFGKNRYTCINCNDF